MRNETSGSESANATRVPTPVVGEGGWSGTAYPAPAEERDGFVIERLLVRPEDGSTPVLVPAEMLVRQEDGALYLPLTRSMALAYAAPDAPEVPRGETPMAAGAGSVGSQQAAPLSTPNAQVPPVATAASTDAVRDGISADERLVIPIVEETLRVAKRLVDTGYGVRVTKKVQETTEVVDEPLLRDDVRVERVPVNQVVEAAPGVRQEGDTIVVPLVEEVLVVQKRLLLREEIRITRQRSETHVPQEVTLRREEAQIERFSPDVDASDVLEEENAISRPGVARSH